MPFEATSFFTFYIYARIMIVDSKNKPTKKKIEDYEPGATQAQVHKALKKVAKSPKPSDKHA